MCGIDGFFSNVEACIVGETYYQAHKMLSHRGPNDEGFVAENQGIIETFIGDATCKDVRGKHIISLKKSKLVLGHCRLSIIDLTSKGHQPMYDETKKFYLVYNGEIYNYKEIKKTLIALGNTFFTDSDTEVVLKAIRQWGCDAFNKFNGMWALAFFDVDKQEVILSRDRFGVKPLYYFFDGSTIYFSSEIKFIKAFCHNKDFQINVQSVNRYLDKCLLNCDEYTFWQDIYEVEPGTNVSYRNGKITTSIYWKFEPMEERWSLSDAIERFEELFADSVRLRMRSDVEVGASLSGGLDSNLVVSELSKQGFLSSKDFKTFSIVFNEGEYSEKDYIKRTVNRFGLRAHYIYPDVNRVELDIDKMLYFLEEPIRSLSVYSLYLLYQYVSRRTSVKVILNGQGADEAFGGYTNHYFQYFADALRHGDFSALKREAVLFKKNRDYRTQDIFRYTMVCFLKMSLTQSNFAREMFRGVKESALREYLRYDDRLSMASAIESRAPFMDYRLIEFAFSLSRDLKIYEFENKLVPREYAKGKLDNSILERKDKMGFVSPQEKWQKTELKLFIDKNLKDIDKKMHTVFGDTLKIKKNPSEDDKWRIVCLNRWLEVNKIG